MDSFLQDARYALRVLRKSPGFALAAVLALALGIGANSAVFSVVNGVLLRPLPFAEPERLVRIFGNFRGIGLERISVSVLEYRDYRELPRALDSVAAYTDADVTLTGQDVPERLRAIMATPSLLPTLGVAPALGRHFNEEEQMLGQERVLLLTHRLWRGRFGANPNILGTTISLDGAPYTVVGVLPEGFEYPRGTDLYLPFAPPANLTTPGSRGSRFLEVVARLKPGVTVQAAQQDMDRVSGELVEANPGNYGGTGGWAISVVSMEEQTVGGVRSTLWVLLGAVGFVLLIACTNVANLLLARAAARGREISIRAALGAGRSRLMTQFLTESVVLSLAGGVLGLVLALWGMDALLAIIGDGLPRASEVRLDVRVVLFTGVISVLTGLLFGLVPALQASRADLHGAMREGSRGTGGRAAGRARGALVVSQVALALVLLIGAGLFMRSFMALQAELRAVDRDLPLFDVAPLEAVVDSSVSQRRFSMLLLLVFAGVAVVLASLGIYGVIAYTVTLRTRELGIRMALGARQADILTLMVGQGLRMTLVGVGIGLALSLGLGRLLSTLLYGIQAHDPLTFVAVAALLVGVALVASWLPARRAAKVDPAITLRVE